MTEWRNCCQCAGWFYSCFMPSVPVTLQCLVILIFLFCYGLVVFKMCVFFSLLELMQSIMRYALTILNNVKWFEPTSNRIWFMRVSFMSMVSLLSFIGTFSVYYCWCWKWILNTASIEVTLTQVMEDRWLSWK